MQPLPLLPDSDYYGGHILHPTPSAPLQHQMSRLLLPADIGFVCGTAWYSAAIRWATQYRGELPTYANHTLGVASVPTSILEARARVTRTPLLDWPLPTQFEFYRHLTLPLTTRVSIAHKAESYEGRVYGGMKIVPHLLDGLLGKVLARDIYLARRFCLIRRYPICSWLWGWAYVAHGVSLSLCDRRFASPDDQHDYVAGSSEWALVMKRFPDGTLAYWDERTGYPAGASRC